MKSEIIFSADAICVEYFFSAEMKRTQIAFTFSPYLNANLNGNGFGGEVLFRNGFDVISFKITGNDWFQTIPITVFAAISKLVESRQYLRRVAYASSMGGYAALAFSRLLDIDIALLYSPQYSIDEEYDRRWERFARQITWKYRITADTISKKCTFFIVYDSKDLDSVHVGYLRSIIPCGNLITATIAYCGHSTVTYLSEVGLMKDMAVKIFHNQSFEGFNFKQNKRKSKSYLFTLSVHLLNRQKLSLSLKLVELAIQIDSKVAAFHKHKSVLLTSMSKLDDAA